MSKKYMVIGNPIDHSFSPIIHEANFKELGLKDWHYEKVLVEDISKIRQIVQDKNIDGFNVTLPFKERIVEYLDEIHLPKGINAINTVKNDNGKFIGYNTDIYGILEDFKEKNIELAGKRMLILGYGGLGKTLASVFRIDGSAEIFSSEFQCISRNLRISSVKVANRSKKDGIDFIANPQEMIEMMSDYDVVVNTTKIGSLDSEELSLESCKSFNGYFYDCTPKQSAIVRRIEKETTGKSFNGLGMLVQQGAKSFEIWTGKSANTEAMKESLKSI